MAGKNLSTNYPAPVFSPPSQSVQPYERTRTTREKVDDSLTASVQMRALRGVLNESIRATIETDDILDDAIANRPGRDMSFVEERVRQFQNIYAIASGAVSQSVTYNGRTVGGGR